MIVKVRKFKKKPVEIEAIKFDGTNHMEIATWMINSDRPQYARNLYLNPSDTQLSITTLEGTMFADIGDYIIRGVKNEFYPCKPDIFELTYEEIL